MGKKHVSQQYREHLSKLVVEEGRTPRQVSEEMDVPVSTLRKWAAAYKKEKMAGKDPNQYITPTELAKKEKEWEKEIRDLKEENEILKKAMNIFAKNP
ncbi:transposase [Geomicrobium sp. JCM 19039]|uniref:transposase n=2 Tax=unclassified Geomicrobium TaxID=2628951 RepID=UPI00045F394F|nr:transposase [Geomicrobium sp. JCM 19039]GAK14753.1 mobile element protein [Geomicrobium sp. JCM 19039]